MEIYPQEDIEKYYVRCNFDDECDLCGNAEHGSYAAGYVNDENGCEVDYYLCGKCASKTIPDLIKQMEEDEKRYQKLMQHEMEKLNNKTP